MGTRNYVKQKVREQTEYANGKLNKKQQKKLNAIIITVGSLLGVSTTVSIINMILLLNLM